MTVTSATTFEARTAADVLIRTFADRRQALAWKRERACEFPGSRVEEVTTTITVQRRRIGAFSLVRSA